MQSVFTGGYAAFNTKIKDFFNLFHHKYSFSEIKMEQNIFVSSHKKLVMHHIKQLRLSLKTNQQRPPYMMNLHYNYDKEV